MDAVEQPVCKHTSSRIVWFTLATVILFVATGALMLWLPYHQRQTDIADLTKRGAIVSTRPGGPTWLRAYFEQDQLTVFNEVVSINAMKSQITDDDVELMLKFPHLQALAIYGPELTERGFARLKELPELRSLLLVNCPNVSPTAVSDLQTALPSLTVARRGSAMLGIAGQTMPTGCLVTMVAHGAAASVAGVRPGDIIVEFDGKPVRGYEALTNLLSDYKPGDTVKIKVLQGGESGPAATVEAKLGSWQ